MQQNKGRPERRDRLREDRPDGKIIRGNIIRIEKVSRLADLSARSELTIGNDLLRERTAVTADRSVDLDHLYVFMHPWSPRFDRYHAVRPGGSKLDFGFRSDDGFPNRKFVSAAAWHETKTGLGAATFIRNIEGKKAPMRYIRSRKSYCKDYLCDYYRSTLPAGRTVVYEAVTGFFRQPDCGKWTADAEALLKKLSGNAK